MSTHDLKAQQSSCQSGEKASVTCVVSDQERFYTHTDKSRFQNVSENSHPTPTALHVQNKEETRTASPPLLQLKGQQKSSRDLQIKQIILFGSKKTSNRTSEGQRESARFTSTISITLPVKRIKKDTTEEKTSTNFYSTLEAVKNTANQRHTELTDVFSLTEQCGESTSELLKDGQKATSDDDALHQHGQNTGIQHNIDHDQARTDHKDSLRHTSSLLVHQVETEVEKESDCRENDSTTLDSGLKASTDSQIFADQPDVFNQVLSLACFPVLHSESSSETKASFINPTSAMLTSALTSVLVPPWSGRLRRPKQGVNEVETTAQDIGQNVNPSTVIRQDRRQQPFIPFQRQPSEQMLANDNNIQVTAGTSYSPDWQKENNSPNVTTSIPQKRPITKSPSVGTVYNRELHSFPTTLDAPNSGYRISKTGDENEPFKSLSSKPTTSSLLLSLRRSNLRNSNPEPTQPQTQITTYLRSLTLPSRVVMKTHSFAQTETPNDQIDTPTGTDGIHITQFPFSPRIKSRVPLHTSMFLNKQETDISKRLEARTSKAEDERFPHHTTNIGQLGSLRAEKSSFLVLRRYSSTQNIDSVDQRTGNSTNLQHSNITTQQITPDTMISPKDSADFKNERPIFHVQNLKSQSTHNITASNSSATSTFTDSLNFSLRKDSSVDGVSPTNVGQMYSKKYSDSSQSSMDLSSPLSPSRPLRSVRVPSIYSYLRESSRSSSSPSPSTPSSHIQNAETSPPNRDGGQWKTLPSKFSFDFNPSVPQKSLSTHAIPAESPDFRRASAPRFSTSPYSSLISSRPSLNSTLKGLSSPPSSKTLTQSYDIGATQLGPTSASTYTGITRSPREHLASSDREQRTTVQDYTSNLDIHRPAQPCLSQAAPDAIFFKESQSANISSHPRQPNTGSNNFPHLEHDDSIALQTDKGNAYPKHKPSEKEKYLPPYKLDVEDETPLTVEKDTTIVQMHDSNSKKGIFAMRVKKDNTFSSVSLPDKELGSFQYFKTKRNLPVFRTSSRIDQMLNRLKLTFGVKRSDSTIDTVTKKSKSQQSSDNETIEIPKTDEKTCFGSQQGTTNYSSTIDKALLGSLSPITSDCILNQTTSKAELQYYGCMEVPNSSLTTDEATIESPRSVKKSDNGLNMDWQNRSTTTNNEQKVSGCMWEASSSSFTTDKALPLIVKKSENASILDWQNRSTNHEQSSCTWDAPSSTLTTNKTHFAPFGYSSPLMSLDNQLNVDQQKSESSENGSQSYGKSCSQHRLKSQNMNRSATLPHYRKSSFGLSSPFYLFDFDSEDIQNDCVFYSPVSKKTNSLCESDDFSPLSSAKSSLQQNLVTSRLSSSCADLKYGLHSGRSFSVSSVVSSRPSGPGRISTSSTSDLSSLDDSGPKGNQTMADSPINTSHSPSYDAKSVTGRQTQTGFTDDCLQKDFEDPTPPPSPTLSSSPRRISQAPAISSPIRTTPENLSPPRCILPSRSYTTSLTVYEESGSDTTTDDEYYLGNGDDDDLETEL